MGGNFAFRYGSTLQRSSEREVWPDDAYGKEERFLISLFAQFVELVEGLFGNKTIGIGCVRTVKGLVDVHILGILADFPVRQSVHRSPRVLPWAGGQEVSVPGFGHLGLVALVPVRPSPSSGVM